MKTKKRLFYTFMILPFILTFFALFFLPDQIPAHYGSNNQVTRWGSKYETLIFPIITAIFGAFMLCITNWSAKQEKSVTNNAKVSLLLGLVSLILFNAMTFYFLYAAFHNVENLSSVPIDLFQLIFGIFGIGMILIGNVMPKLRMNSVIGLRTVWSMKNETTWKKSQRFGGITFILTGIVTILACFFTKGVSCSFWSIGALCITSVADIIYTYRISKKY